MNKACRLWVAWGSINEAAILLKIRNSLPVNKYCLGSSEGIIKIKVDRW
jgi:hypothetical protein